MTLSIRRCSNRRPIPASMRGSGLKAPSIIGVLLHTVAISPTIYDLTKAPKWSGTVFAGTTWALMGGLLTTRAEYFRQASMFNDAFNSPLFESPSYSSLNAWIGFESPEHHWSASAYGRNLTDEL